MRAGMQNDLLFSLRSRDSQGGVGEVKEKGPSIAMTNKREFEIIGKRVPNVDVYEKVRGLQNIPGI